jgi:DNA polymerase-3 subunit alpha
MTGAFVHFNVHSEYSLVDGLLRVDDLVDAAVAAGMPAVAITEQGNLFSTVKFYRAAESAGIKPVIGVQIRLLDDERGSQVGRMTLLCQDTEGYHNITSLITRSYMEGQVYGIPHVRKNWLKECAGGLIALSGAVYGDIGQAILAGNEVEAAHMLEEWQAVFPDRYYLELHRTQRPHEENYIIAAVALAQRCHTPVVATNDVRFLSAEDYEAHEARVCIQQGHTLDDPRRPRHYSQSQYLRNADEMSALFADIPEALANTLAVARRCNLELPLGATHLPLFPVPENHNQDDWLIQEATKGLTNRIQAGQIDKSREEVYRERLDTELKVILGMGFAGYFLIVADFIRWAKEQHIPVGPGRGSGAGSLVAYALDITELDPLPYDLLFERFLNPERVSLPDFDIDFCMDRRDEVIDYVAHRYGREHVAQIITHGTMAAKAVVRDVGRVLGYTYGFVDQIAKLIPFDLNMTLDRALEEEPVLRERYDKEETVNTLINLARKLEGLTRNAGRHAGGIVIAPEPLTHYMPLYCEQGSGSPVTQFDMMDVEAIGLVKFDFLGLRTLTIIDQTVRDINAMQSGGEKTPMAITSIPLGDYATYELIRRTDTTAIFQLESDGMKKLIKRLQPDNFNDLIALVALFRPGPLQSGMVDDYIERKHGRARVYYPHPRLEHVLRPTYGVILYQEQVMQIAQLLAGYTLGAADLLRRAMGKKKPEEMAEQREIFTKGAVANGVDVHVATNIFDLMEKFAGYGFNKSHSAAYALVAYQTAWLKAHHPAAFMAAVLSSDMDNTDKVVMLLDELERMQLRLEPPHINKSAYMFTVDAGNAIRYGLGAIKGVGRAAVENIVDERSKNGAYIDLFDFCRRIDLKKANRRVLEALIKCGAMDDLGPNRGSIMASLNTAIQLAEQFNTNTVSGQDDLFGLDQIVHDEGHGRSKSEFIKVADWNDEERLAGEKETLGFYLHGHPIIRYENELGKFVTSRLKDLRPGNVLVAGYIHRLRTRSMQRGRMAEIVLDDRNGRANLKLFPDKYQQYRDLLIKDKLIIVRGDYATDDFVENGYAITGREIYDIDEMRNRQAGLRLKLSAEQAAGGDTLDRIRTALSGYRTGNCKIRVDYLKDGVSCSLELGSAWKVTLNDNLLELLKNILGNGNVVIEYNS